MPFDVCHALISVMAALSIRAVHPAGTSSLAQCQLVTHNRIEQEAYFETRPPRQASSKLHHSAADLVTDGRMALLMVVVATRCRSGVSRCIRGHWALAAMSVVTESFRMSGGLLGDSLRACDRIARFLRCHLGVVAAT